MEGARSVCTKTGLTILLAELAYRVLIGRKYHCLSELDDSYRSKSESDECK